MIERELAAKRITKLESELTEAKSAAGRWMAEAVDRAEYVDVIRNKITELEAKLAGAEADVKRLRRELTEADDIWRMYCKRLDFVAQVARGEFDPPTIAEIRKARGLDPL